MALKAVVTKDEHAALPDATRAFYKAEGESFILDAEGLDTHPTTKGLKTALDAERTGRSSITAELSELKKKFEGIDSEAAREALAKLKDLERAALEGDIPDKFKGEFEKAVTARVKGITDDYDAKLKASNTKVETLTAENRDLNQKLSNLTIGNEVRSAGSKLGMHDWAIEDAVLHAQTGGWSLDKDAKPVLHEAGSVVYGKDGAKKSIEEWMTELAKKRPGWVKPSTGSGAENGGQGTRQEGKVMWVPREVGRDREAFRAVEAKAKEKGLEIRFLPEATGAVQ